MPACWMTISNDDWDERESDRQPRTCKQGEVSWRPCSCGWHIHVENGALTVSQWVCAKLAHSDAIHRSAFEPFQYAAGKWLISRDIAMADNVISPYQALRHTDVHCEGIEYAIVLVASRAPRNGHGIRLPSGQSVDERFASWSRQTSERRLQQERWAANFGVDAIHDYLNVVEEVHLQTNFVERTIWVPLKRRLALVCILPLALHGAIR